MRVLMISANTESINMTTIPIGLGAVAGAARRAGHEVEWLDLMNEPDPDAAVAAAIGRCRPEVIGISVRNIDDQARANPRFLLDKARAVVAACRAGSKATIVVGGAGYSIFPESALEYLGADLGVQGEGEAVFPELLARLQKGAALDDLAGLYRRGRGRLAAPGFVADLDSLPPPEASIWSSYRSAREVWMPFQTRRGCPMDCSYCSTAVIEGRRIRKRSLERAVESLVQYAAAGFNRIYFTDNTFNLPRAYAAELCRSMSARKLDLAWRCILYPKGIDAALVRAMAAAGCREVSLGFESGSEKILAAMNKRFDPPEVRRIAGLLADAGIRRMGFLLLGGPGETRATAAESVAFADSLQLEALRLSAGVRIYPGTALAATARSEGVISPDDNLLVPRFYLAAGLEEWLPAQVREWAATRPHWMV